MFFASTPPNYILHIDTPPHGALESATLHLCLGFIPALWQTEGSFPSGEFELIIIFHAKSSGVQPAEPIPSR